MKVADKARRRMSNVMNNKHALDGLRVRVTSSGSSNRENGGFAMSVFEHI